MFENFESKITFEIPTDLDFDKLIRSNNYTLFWQNIQHDQIQSSISSDSDLFFNSPNGSDFNLLNSIERLAGKDTGNQLMDSSYEKFIGDVWVGIVLTLMILSSIFCMCSCFLYHKFRQWQRSVLTARSNTLSSMDAETPPPYDVESLPSYTIVSGLPSYNDAIEQLKERQQKHSNSNYEPVKVHRPSVIKLFESQSQDLMNNPKLEEIRYNFTSQKSMVNNDCGVSTESPDGSSSTSNKNHISTIAVTSNFKKFNVCLYTLENERNNNNNNS